MRLDSRHQKRIKLMQQIFAATFVTKNASQVTINQPRKRDYLADFFSHLEEIDQRIATIARERPIDQINKLDLAILRATVFESMVQSTPVKVLINEAVEIAKEFGSESSPKFVNGVLGKLLVQKEAKNEK